MSEPEALAALRNQTHGGRHARAVARPRTGSLPTTTGGGRARRAEVATEGRLDPVPSAAPRQGGARQLAAAGRDRRHERRDEHQATWRAKPRLSTSRREPSFFRGTLAAEAYEAEGHRRPHDPRHAQRI
jgi:hypothetical protein